MKIKISINFIDFITFTSILTFKYRIFLKIIFYSIDFFLSPVFVNFK